MLKSVEHREKYGIKWRLPDDTLHRVDGPAVIWDQGCIEYWQYGKRHRLDGPAYIDPYDDNDIPLKEWWINDEEITEDIGYWAEEVGIDLDSLTEDDKLLIIMKWGQ